MVILRVIYNTPIAYSNWSNFSSC